MIDNMGKSLDSYFKNPENRGKQIILLINGLDRIVRSNYDLKIFFYFLGKLFADGSCSQDAEGLHFPSIKLILTISCSSLFAHSHSLVNSLSTSCKTTTRLVTYFVKKLESQFHNCKPIIKINIDYHRNPDSSSSSSSQSSLSLNERLAGILFSSAEARRMSLSASQSEATSHSANNLATIVDLLVYLLNETRYGVKQTEIFDLFRSSMASLNIKSLNRTSLIYVLNFAWLLLFLFIFENQLLKAKAYIYIYAF
jgi:hypothetical protein